METSLSERSVVKLPRESLRQIPLLSLLSDDLLNQVMQSSRIQHFPKNTTVLMKGVVNDWLGILLTGNVQVIDTLANGIEVGLNMLGPGSFFGEITVIDRQPRSASIVAMTECDIIMMPGDVARQLFFRHPPVAEALQVHFAYAMRRMGELRTLLSLPHAYQRIYALLSFIQKSGPGGMVHIEHMPTHHELAIMANTSRETVTRALSDLSRRGIIEKDARRLIICRPDELLSLLEVI